MTNLSTGNYGEDLACEYLKKIGYQILQRNFRIRGGEIDIVAKDKQYTVFVEVKARNSYEYGLPIESITPWKIKTLIRSALFYVTKHHLQNTPYRIDVISVDLVDKSNPKIQLHKNITL